jgi:hypothetical protein
MRLKPFSKRRRKNVTKKHTHEKHIHCEHVEVAFCGHCDVAYCKNCKQEWGERCTMQHYPQYAPYYGTTTVTPGWDVITVSGTADHSSSDVTHTANVHSAHAN